VRSLALTAARAALLAEASVLAFFSGGYFPAQQAWAGLAAWILVVVAALLNPPRRRWTRAAWLAIGGLALLGGWTLVSLGWAPVAGDAYHAAMLVFLYLGVLLAAVLLFDGRPPAAVVPALGAGAAIVVTYGISERLLPGLLHFSRSLSAQGRLEQPLTYWNAMGELAALGFVLCSAVAGDGSRSRWLRVAATAASVPVALGLYLSFSRGALFACAAGLIALVVAAPRRAQLDAVLIGLGAGVLASLAAAPFGGVTSLAGRLSVREAQGTGVLAALVVVTAAAVAAHLVISRRPDRELALPRRAPVIALGLICAGLALAIVVGAKEASNRPLSGGASRLVSFQSNRYAYWSVALRAFGDHPLEGVGAGGWAVWWLRYRPFDDFAKDAHSLPLQTAAELGVVGLILLGMFVGGVALGARGAYRSAPVMAAGPIAGVVAYAAHAPLDWDWQMPAVTVIAIVLAGALLAADRPIRSGRPALAGGP
jgi:hypothetical protein